MGFWAKLLDDREKSINPMHLVMAFLVLNSVAWVWYSVLKNHGTIPELSGIAALLGGGGAANLAHKAEDIVAKLKSTPVVIPNTPVVVNTDQIRG